MSLKSIQNMYLPSGMFAYSTGAVNGYDHRLMYTVDMFSCNHSFRITNSSLDMECKGPQVAVSPSVRFTSWAIPHRWGESLYAKIFSNNIRISWLCGGTISFTDHCFRPFHCITLLMSSKDAINVVNGCLLTLLKKDSLFSITISPWNGHGSQNFSSNNSWLYTGSGGSSVMCCTVCRESLGMSCSAVIQT